MLIIFHPSPLRSRQKTSHLRNQVGPCPITPPPPPPPGQGSSPTSCWRWGRGFDHSPFSQPEKSHVPLELRGRRGRSWNPPTHPQQRLVLDKPPIHGGRGRYKQLILPVWQVPNWNPAPSPLSLLFSPARLFYPVISIPKSVNQANLSDAQQPC